MFEDSPCCGARGAPRINILNLYCLHELERRGSAHSTRHTSLKNEGRKGGLARVGLRGGCRTNRVEPEDREGRVLARQRPDDLGAAIGETVIPLHPPLPLVGVSIAMERERQQNGSLAYGYLGALGRDQHPEPPQPLRQAATQLCSQSHSGVTLESLWSAQSAPSCSRFLTFDRGRAARFVRAVFSPSSDSPFSIVELCVSGRGAGVTPAWGNTPAARPCRPAPRRSGTARPAPSH